MAKSFQKVRNGPKSIKAVSRGMGLGMSLLPNQPIQTTAIPQTPAVCTAAVKWKNKIQPPDKVAIIEKDENTEQISSNKYDKQWSELVNKSPPPGDKTTDSKDPSTSNGAPDGDRNSTARASLVSTEVDKSPVHSIQQPQQQRQQIKKDEDDDAEKPNEVTRAENQLITAIPCMPLSLAVICLILNIFMPGTGTIISSFSLFCCSKQQAETAQGKKEATVDLMITNLCVGVSQLFTVTFLFIGFIWSVTWGIFMVQFAYVQYKKDKEERERLAAISVANAFLRPGFR